MNPIPAPSEEKSASSKRPPSRHADTPERLIDSKEAAAIIGIHPKTLQKMARRGQIRGVHVGKLWRAFVPRRSKNGLHANLRAESSAFGP